MPIRCQWQLPALLRFQVVDVQDHPVGQLACHNCWTCYAYSDLHGFTRYLQARGRNLLLYLVNHDGTLLSSLKAVHLGNPKITPQDCMVLCQKHAMMQCRMQFRMPRVPRFRIEIQPSLLPLRLLSRTTSLHLFSGPTAVELQGAGCSGRIACFPPQPSTASCPTRILSMDFVLGSSRRDAVKFAHIKGALPTWNIWGQRKGVYSNVQYLCWGDGIHEQTI